MADDEPSAIDKALEAINEQVKQAKTDRATAKGELEAKQQELADAEASAAVREAGAAQLEALAAQLQDLAAAERAALALARDEAGTTEDEIKAFEASIDRGLTPEHKARLEPAVDEIDKRRDDARKAADDAEKAATASEKVLADKLAKKTTGDHDYAEAVASVQRRPTDLDAARERLSAARAAVKAAIDGDQFAKAFIGLRDVRAALDDLTKTIGETPKSVANAATKRIDASVEASAAERKAAIDRAAAAEAQQQRDGVLAAREGDLDEAIATLDAPEEIPPGVQPDDGAPGGAPPAPAPS